MNPFLQLLRCRSRCQRRPGVARCIAAGSGSYRDLSSYPFCFKKFQIGAAFLSIIAGFRPDDLKGITITQDGTPRATIVIARDALGAPTEPPMANLSADVSATTTNKFAAAALDLQVYVEKISGAKLPIVSDEKDPGGTIILIGKSLLTQSMNEKIPSGLTRSRREESFLVLCKGDRLLLAGNDEGPYHGTEYAVAEFLERLGVRWFIQPGKSNTIAVRMNTGFNAAEAPSGFYSRLFLYSPKPGAEAGK